MKNIHKPFKHIQYSVEIIMNDIFYLLDFCNHFT